MTTSLNEVFSRMQIPVKLSEGIYEGFILKSLPEVTEGDFVFSMESQPSEMNQGNIAKQAKSVA